MYVDACMWLGIAIIPSAGQHFVEKWNQIEKFGFSVIARL